MQKTKQKDGTVLLGGMGLDQVYPVDAVFLSAVNTNPSFKFGGTWVLAASGTDLMGTTGFTIYAWRRTA